MLEFLAVNEILPEFGVSSEHDDKMINTTNVVRDLKNFMFIILRYYL
ncbi:hypothetical protein T190820D02B_40081 [Tenacibaculum sp. 190524A05c]